MTASRGARSATWSTARSSVTLIFSPRNIASRQLLDPGPARDGGEQRHRLGGDAVLRVVEHDVARLGHEPGAALRVLGEQVTEMPVGDARRDARAARATLRSPRCRPRSDLTVGPVQPRSTSPLEPERVEQIGQPAGEPDQPVHQQEHPEREQDRGRHEGDRAQVPAEEAEGAGRRAEGDADREERHAHPERVRGEERDRACRRLRRGGAEDGGEHRSEARRPSEPERGADDRRGRPPEPAGHHDPLLRVEPRRHEHLRTGEVRAPSAMMMAPDTRVSVCWLSNAAWPISLAARPRIVNTVPKPRVNSPVISGDPPEPLATALVELGDGEPGDDAQVAGHHRQHARREDRDDPAAERDDHADVLGGDREHAGEATGWSATCSGRGPARGGRRRRGRRRCAARRGRRSSRRSRRRGSGGRSAPRRPQSCPSP